MNVVQSDVTIIGGGLTGLLLANLLRDKNLNVIVVEARERLGGRIFTKYKDGFAPQEMGATWLGKNHSALTNLLKKLDLGIFEQALSDRAIYEPISTSPPQLVRLPTNADPSYRIKGGSSTLIKKLENGLDADKIFTNQIVTSIEKNTSVFSIKTATHNFQSDIAISTLPPYLLTSTIKISPSLPDSFLEIAKYTHTWMGESIKVGLTYEKPFWRTKNSSGTIFSNVGPIPEMYDHSNFEDNLFALKGFLNGAYFSVSKAERLALVMRQLEKYFGTQVSDFLMYEETVWRIEPFTFAPYSSHVLPHQNNGHSVFQQAYLDGKFHIAGAETATQYPGYMEGAVRSAQAIFQKIKTQLNLI